MYSYRQRLFLAIYFYKTLYYFIYFFLIHFLIYVRKYIDSFRFVHFFIVQPANNWNLNNIQIFTQFLYCFFVLFSFVHIKEEDREKKRNIWEMQLSNQNELSVISLTKTRKRKIKNYLNGSCRLKMPKRMIITKHP